MTQKYLIKELEIIDLQRALTLVWNVFLEFEAPDYSDEGIQEFKSFLEYESMKAKLQDNQVRMWVCFENENLVGVLATSRTRPTCHICLLFVDKEHHRKGIARSLFNTMTEYYKMNSNYSEITVFSSPYAVEAYHRLGFENTDTEQTINGIRFTPMKRPL